MAMTLEESSGSCKDSFMRNNFRVKGNTSLGSRVALFVGPDARKGIHADPFSQIEQKHEPNTVHISFTSF